MIKIKYKEIPVVKKQLLKKQDNKCPICQRNLKNLPSKQVCLDHNHKTGMIRAVLCRGCNSMEGKVQRMFVRMGLKKQGVDYFNFLVGLANYNMEESLGCYDTEFIHPKFKVKK